jgi:hypothetical protein
LDTLGLAPVIQADVHYLGLSSSFVFSYWVLGPLKMDIDLLVQKNEDVSWPKISTSVGRGYHLLPSSSQQKHTHTHTHTQNTLSSTTTRPFHFYLFFFRIMQSVIYSTPLTLNYLLPGPQISPTSLQGHTLITMSRVLRPQQTNHHHLLGKTHWRNHLFSRWSPLRWPHRLIANLPLGFTLLWLPDSSCCFKGILS